MIAHTIAGDDGRATISWCDSAALADGQVCEYRRYKAASWPRALYVMALVTEGGGEFETVCEASWAVMRACQSGEFPEVERYQMTPEDRAAYDALVEADMHPPPTSSGPYLLRDIDDELEGERPLISRKERAERVALGLGFRQ